MFQTRTLVLTGIALAMAALVPAATLQAQNSNPSTPSDYRTTLQLYCVGCHSGPNPFAGLNLEPKAAELYLARGVAITWRR